MFTVPKNNLPQTTPSDEFILLAINSRRLYSLDIQERIEFLGDKKIAYNTLHVALTRLEKKGLLGSEWSKKKRHGGDRKHYFLTDKGRAVIDNMLAAQKRLLG